MHEMDYTGHAVCLLLLLFYNRDVTVPVGGVGLQVLDDVFGYGPSKDGLSFTQIDLVRRDL